MTGERMNYPTMKKSPSSSKIKNTSRRGMTFEKDINQSNDYYLTEKLAVIHKKPTPVTIVKVDYPKRSSAKITEAYFQLPSTTDYNGIYQGKYIDFEAKECHSEHSFPFTSIHHHQIEHLRSVLQHGGIAFLLLRMNVYQQDFLIPAQRFIDFYDQKIRKSLSWQWIQENAYLIPNTYLIPVDYLQIVRHHFL